MGMKRFACIGSKGPKKMILMPTCLVEIRPRQKYNFQLNSRNILWRLRVSVDRTESRKQNNQTHLLGLKNTAQKCASTISQFRCFRSGIRLSIPVPEFSSTYSKINVKKHYLAINISYHDCVKWKRHPLMLESGHTFVMALCMALSKSTKIIFGLIGYIFNI